MAPIGVSVIRVLCNVSRPDGSHESLQDLLGHGYAGHRLARIPSVHVSDQFAKSLDIVALGRPFRHLPL